MRAGYAHALRYRWGVLLYLSEIIRFVRRNSVVFPIACFLLAIGFLGSVLTLMMILSTSSGVRGVRQMNYATIAEESGGGSSAPIDLDTFEMIHNRVQGMPVIVAGYTASSRVPFRLNTNQGELSLAAATPGFFTDLTDTLIVGRDLSKSTKDQAEIILSEALARKLFFTSSAALDRGIEIKGTLFHIVGVAAPAFHGLWSNDEAWITPQQKFILEVGGVLKSSPLEQGITESWSRFPQIYVVVACKAGGALSGMIRPILMESQASQHPLRIDPGITNDPVRDAKIHAWARLAFLVSLILLVATAFNFCALMFAQASKQVEEVRLKRILGAGAGQLLFDISSGPLTTVLVGCLLAFGLSVGAISYSSKYQSYLLWNRLSWKTVFVALSIEFAVACGLALIVALIPALKLLRESGSLQFGYTSTMSKKASWVLQAIVCVQIASCITICTLAGMIYRSVHTLSRQSLGYASDHLMAIEIDAVGSNGSMTFSTDATHDFPMASMTRLLLQEINNRFPGVHAESAASCAPMGQALETISIESLDSASARFERTVPFCAVSQQFFTTMKNPIMMGHGFSDDSLTGPISEIIVNRSLANQLWPGVSPLHHFLRIERKEWNLIMDAEVVGVSEDMHFVDPSNGPEATIFLPLKSNSFTLAIPLYILLRGDAPLHETQKAINQQASIAMPGMGVTAAYGVAERVQAALRGQVLRVMVSSAGALLIAIIAYLGLYGVITQFINSRRKEMALRICFGATNLTIGGIILRQAGLCGLLAALASLTFSKILEHVTAGTWFGASDWSWSVAIGISVGCVAVSIGIALIAMRVALRLEPNELLRNL